MYRRIARSCESRVTGPRLGLDTFNAVNGRPPLCNRHALLNGTGHWPRGRAEISIGTPFDRSPFDLWPYRIKSPATTRFGFDALVDRTTRCGDGNRFRVQRPARKAGRTRTRYTVNNKNLEKLEKKKNGKIWPARKARHRRVRGSPGNRLGA